MKNPKLAALIAALSIAGCWNQGRAENGTSPRPPAAPSSPPLSEPVHQKFTDDAWNAFENGHYEAAITNADRCIALFGEAADRIQAILESRKETLPTGMVSEADQKRIASYQMLHDVAVCFLVKGWTEEKLGHQEAARKAYGGARKFTYARSSRPTGKSFWSPAERAVEALAQ